MERCKNTVELGYNVLKAPYVVITDEYIVGLMARNCYHRISEAVGEAYTDVAVSGLYCIRA
jgi:hypothetical protein